MGFVMNMENMLLPSSRSKTHATFLIPKRNTRLSTLCFAGRAFLKTVGTASDPNSLGFFDLRFTATVKLEDKSETSIWRMGNDLEVAFERIEEGLHQTEIRHNQSAAT